MKHAGPQEQQREPKSKCEFAKRVGCRRFRERSDHRHAVNWNSWEAMGRFDTKIPDADLSRWRRASSNLPEWTAAQIVGPALAHRVLAH
jgi:hypothetical protein